MLTFYVFQLILNINFIFKTKIYIFSNIVWNIAVIHIEAKIKNIVINFEITTLH